MKKTSKNKLILFLIMLTLLELLQNDVKAREEYNYKINIENKIYENLIIEDTPGSAIGLYDSGTAL